MPLVSKTLSQLLTPIPINPGSAGWDAALTKFLQEANTYAFERLVTRVETLAPASSAAGSVVVSCPAGMICVVTKIMFYLRGGTLASPQNYDIFRGTNSADNSWAGNGSGGSVVDFSNLAIHRPLMVWPRPGSTLFADNAPEAIPLLDGDDLTLQTLNIQKTAGNSLTLGIHVYGFAYPKNDP